MRKQKTAERLTDITAGKTAWIGYGRERRCGGHGRKKVRIGYGRITVRIGYGRITAQIGTGRENGSGYRT